MVYKASLDSVIKIDISGRNCHQHFSCILPWRKLMRGGIRYSLGNSIRLGRQFHWKKQSTRTSNKWTSQEVTRFTLLMIAARTARVEDVANCMWQMETGNYTIPSACLACPVLWEGWRSLFPMCVPRNQLLGKHFVYSIAVYLKGRGSQQTFGHL